MKKVLLLLAALSSFGILYSQSFQVNSSVTPEIEVCGSEVTFQIVLQNIGGTYIQNPEIGVTLPLGISYVGSSLNETTSQNLQEQNISNLLSPTFTAGGINSGDSISFTISLEADMDAIGFQNNGGVFRNSITVTYGSGSDNYQSSSYNILYPALSILSISPTSQTILSGGSTTRTITLINGGNGKTDRVYLSDLRNSGALTLDAVDLGVLSGDSIILSGNDFLGVGNGDQYLDEFESITITETLSGTSCSNTTVTSSIRAHWGCDGNLSSSSTSFGHVSIDFQSPNLKLSSSESLSSCFGSGAGSPQELAIRNSGSGFASGVEVEIFKSTGSGYDQDIFSRIDLGSLQYKVGSRGNLNPVPSPNTTTTQSSGLYSCLGNNPIGKVNFTLPNLAPGDTAFIVWDMYSCCLSLCQDDAVKGWEASVDYTDVCGTTNYSGEIEGQERNNQLMTIFTESPIDISDGQVRDFSFIISSFENTLPMGQGAAYKTVFTLDPGLSFQALDWSSNNIDWVPTQISYDPTNHTVEALFPASAPFTVAKSELQLGLVGSCGNSGWKTIEMDVFYLPDTSCISGCEIPLVCDVQTTTYLHCPSGVCSSLNVLDFSAVRANTGFPDNNLDGLPDGAGNLNPNKIKLNRAMVGDTILATSLAVIEPTSDTWAYSGFTSSIDYGSVLGIIDATAIIYDASSGSTDTVQAIPSTSSISGNQQDFSFDLSVGVLSNLNAAFANYTYSSGDSIRFLVQYEVESSVNGLIKESTWLNEFYLSDVSNPNNAQKESCSFKNGRLTLIGYAWMNKSPNNITVSSCTKNIVQDFGLSIGDLSSNYGGGNLFPFEYRHWGTLKQVRVVLPPNYSHVNTKLRYYPTQRTNSTANQVLNNLGPDATIGDTLYYNISSYFASNQLRSSDDGWDGRLLVEVAPNCDVPEDTYEDVEWFFDFQASEAIDGASTGYIPASSPDRIKYRPSTLSLSSNNPIQDALTRKVNWDYKVRNNSSNGADNVWIHLPAPQNITIDSIAFDGGSSLVQQNDLYLIGSINAGGLADLTIYGTVSGCDSINMTVYSGYECTGYPNEFASFSCNYEELDLYVEPKEADYQTRISDIPLQGPCTQQVELTLEITSVKLGHMYDMSIDLISPDTNSIKILNGSSEFQYNTSSPYSSIANPTAAAGVYHYNINDYVSSFASNGIPGVLDINNNRYRLRLELELGTQFIQGDILQIQIAGSNACNVPLPLVELAYDPNAKFDKDLTAGLHLDIGNSWSASWGDYDNDGFDDLFVPVNDLNQPSILYHNNGDGTFTNVSLPPLTTDPGTSIAGTWGDYDNDGFLDLFVANNISSNNKLYHNNGNGTFTSIQNNPIVDEGVYSHGCAWADYNQDGNLDLVVSDFHPTNFNFLFKGDGQGGFEADANSVIALSASSALGVSWGDYDNDGDPDLFIANTNGENNQLFKNENGVFQEITASDIVTDGGTSVGGVWGDYDNDGDLDLFVTNAGATEPNFFYENTGGGTFTRITSGTIVDHVGNSHGASWIDFDNDGDLDLIVANDAGQENFFFTNNGNKTFTKTSNAITQEQNDSYGTAWSDYDNDGDYDLFIANRGNNVNDFFINEKGSCTNHIIVKLNGCNSNKCGIGARVVVMANLNGVPISQTKHVSTQTSAMGGQNSSKLLFGILDATSIDSVVVYWPSGIVSTILNPVINQMLTINEACGAKVCGVVYHDVNENGVQDQGEEGIPNKKLIVQPGNFQVLTNELGAYELYLEDGSYTIEQAPDSLWSQLTPLANASYPLNISLASQIQYCGNDFGNKAICPYPDLALTLGTTAFRRGLTNDLHVSISNSGAFATQGPVILNLVMTETLYLVDGGWDNVSVNGNLRTYTYSIPGLAALSDTVLQLVDSVANNAPLGDLINVDAVLQYGLNECGIGNNSYTLSEEIVGSIDPNDKQVMIMGDGSRSRVTEDDKLLYRIRFQNMGTYAARIVTIVDTLSELLDWSTLSMEGSSHPFDMTMANGVVTWKNDGIELPDSTSDPEGSQGYIMFSISPLPGLTPYTAIENRASIRFDYNEWISTNNTSIYVQRLERLIETPEPIIYPNPASESITVILLDTDNNPMQISSIQVSDLSGRKLLKEPVSGIRTTLNILDLPAGIYLIEVETPSGSTYRKRFTVAP